MGFHKVEEGKRYLYKELDQMLHALQSGKAKLTAQSASALANIIQGLEMTKLFEDIREMGGLKHLLEQFAGGSHGHQRQMGFHVPHHHYGQHSRMPDKRWTPQMDYRYDISDDYDMDMDITDDYDRYENEMARRRRLPPRDRRGRFRRRRGRYELENDMDRYDAIDDVIDLIHNAMRTTRNDTRADYRTTNDMRMDSPTGDTNRQAPMR